MGEQLTPCLPDIGVFEYLEGNVSNLIHYVVPVRILGLFIYLKDKRELNVYMWRGGEEGGGEGWV